MASLECLRFGVEAIALSNKGIVASFVRPERYERSKNALLVGYLHRFLEHLILPSLLGPVPLTLSQDARVRSPEERRGEW